VRPCPSLEHIRPESNDGRVEMIGGAGARFDAAPTRRKQRLFLELRAQQLHTKHADALILLKVLVDQSTLAPRRLQADVPWVRITARTAVGGKGKKKNEINHYKFEQGPPLITSRGSVRVSRLRDEN